MTCNWIVESNEALCIVGYSILYHTLSCFRIPTSRICSFVLQNKESHTESVLEYIPSVPVYTVTIYSSGNIFLIHFSVLLYMCV